MGLFFKHSDEVHWTGVHFNDRVLIFETLKYGTLGRSQEQFQQE